MLLITGANGQLGSCLAELVPADRAYFLDVQDLDITDEAAVRAFGASHEISGIVNCAAYTNVDKAEDEPEAAYKINVTGAENLAKLAAEKCVPLVQISTDYVFDGTAHLPIPEDAPANPQSVYGQTKLAGEKAVLKYAETAVIIRTAWLYSPYGKNFLKTMLKLAAEKPQISVVADQIGTPTYAGHLARAIVRILPQIKAGTKAVYHFTDEGVAGWYDFASAILSKAGFKTPVLPIATAAYPAKAKRPAYSVLCKAKIKRDFNIPIDHWIKGVETCLKKLS